jgi:hypothetical protein
MATGYPGYNQMRGYDPRTGSQTSTGVTQYVSLSIYVYVLLILNVSMV